MTYTNLYFHYNVKLSVQRTGSIRSRAKNRLHGTPLLVIKRMVGYGRGQAAVHPYTPGVPGIGLDSPLSIIVHYS